MLAQRLECVPVQLFLGGRLRWHILSTGEYSAIRPPRQYPLRFGQLLALAGAPKTAGGPIGCRGLGRDQSAPATHRP